MICNELKKTNELVVGDYFYMNQHIENDVLDDEYDPVIKMPRVEVRIPIKEMTPELESKLLLLQTLKQINYEGHGRSFMGGPYCITFIVWQDDAEAIIGEIQSIISRSKIVSSNH